jgi:hypothetical protein
LHRLAQFPAEYIDLIYLDPPFFSNRSYAVIWGDEAEVRSFEDRWEGEVNVYVNWMRERVIEMHRVLKPTGTIFLHCDWHAAHYLKVMLDDVFDEKNFQNELIWFYKGGGSSPRRWSRKHDTIFWYSKGKTWTFNLDEVRTARPGSDRGGLRVRRQGRAGQGARSLRGRGHVSTPASAAASVLAAIDDVGAPGRVGVVGTGEAGAMARTAVESRGGTCEHPSPLDGRLDLLLDVSGDVAQWQPLLGAVRHEGTVLTMVATPTTDAAINLYRGIHNRSLRFVARRWDPPDECPDPEEREP